MNWWAFQWTPTFNRIFILICLYTLLIDLMLFANGQSMFSWTPIIKEGKKLINPGSVEHLKPAKRFFFMHDNSYNNHVHSKPNEESVPLKHKDDPYRIMINTKESKPAPNELHVNIQRNSNKNGNSEKHRTVSREIKFIPQYSNNPNTTQNNFSNVVTKVSNIKQITKEKTSTPNSKYYKTDKAESRSDDLGFLSWKSIETQSKSKTNFSFNPSLKDPSKKRVKKNVKSTKEIKNKINVPLKEVDGKGSTKTLNTLSAKFFSGEKGDINQTHTSNAPRFFGMVIVNSEIKRSTKDNQNDTKERREGKNKK